MQELQIEAEDKLNNPGKIYFSLCELSGLSVKIPAKSSQTLLLYLPLNHAI